MTRAGEPLEADDVSACTDCLLTVANDLPEDLDPARVEAITTGLAAFARDGWTLTPGDGDEQHFSWSSCQVCGDRRGGDRHHLSAIRRPHPNPQQGPAMRHVLIDPTTHTAYWLAAGHTLTAATLDPGTGTPDWGTAAAVDLATADAPDLMLSIAEALTLRGHSPAPVPPEAVIDRTGARLGYLVRDPAGADVARYDRLDLAAAAARTGGGTVHAWGSLDHSPPGWHQITTTPHPGPPRASAPAHPTPTPANTGTAPGALASGVRR